LRLQVAAGARHGGFLLRGDGVVIVGIRVENAGLAVHTTVQRGATEGSKQRRKVR